MSVATLVSRPPAAGHLPHAGVDGPASALELDRREHPEAARPVDPGTGDGRPLDVAGDLVTGPRDRVGGGCGVDGEEREQGGAVASLEDDVGRAGAGVGDPGQEGAGELGLLPGRAAVVGPVVRDGVAVGAHGSEPVTVGREALHAVRGRHLVAAAVGSHGRE